MPYIKPVTGQSNYDLCLKAYGSLDVLIDFLKDNSISDVNVVKNQLYYYDENKVVNVNAVGYDYATDIR